MASKFSFFQNHTKSIDPSPDILVLFSQFVRKASIHSKESYVMASEVYHFMNRYLNSITDCVIELNVECQAVASLQKRLQKRIGAYLQQSTVPDNPRTLKVN